MGRDNKQEKNQKKKIKLKIYMNNEIINVYQEDSKNFYKIIGGFRKANGNMPSLDRTLNLLLMYLNSRS